MYFVIIQVRNLLIEFSASKNGALKNDVIKEMSKQGIRSSISDSLTAALQAIEGEIVRTTPPPPVSASRKSSPVKKSTPIVQGSARKIGTNAMSPKESKESLNTHHKEPLNVHRYPLF